ncbi:MotA/TolQ/ExbB proton channel family protein [Sulfurospirillum sp.]|uniref:MotA/TolQ/ExbB proton channel family protein n=1 Tax=Sulfurospirillum sp. TaxID=2053622 RepID=UPI002FDE6677
MEYLKFSIDYGIMGLLFCMSILSFGLFIERVFFYKALVLSSYKTKKSLEIALSNHLTTIATITSNAPYIGLLGTVLAIMLTFMNMSEQGIEATKIMSSLALALKTTAVGLVVAIVSMVFNNILVRYSERFLADYDEEV